MNEKFIPERITELRLKKNVSEYRMSLDLGHSNSYIRSITSGKSLPSMYEFLYMCDYLGITPKEFFDSEIKNPAKTERLCRITRNMSDDNMDLLITLAERLANKDQ